MDFHGETVAFGMRTFSAVIVLIGDKNCRRSSSQRGLVDINLFQFWCLWPPTAV